MYPKSRFFNDNENIVLKMLFNSYLLLGGLCWTQIYFALARDFR